MDCLVEYNRMHDLLKRQLRKMAPHFNGHSEVDECHRNILKDHTGEVNLEVKKVARYLAMLLSIKAGDILKKRWLHKLYCYNDIGEKINLKKMIQTDDHVRVMFGEMKGRPVVVKWYKSEKRDTTYEIATYRRLRDMGCPVPWFSARFEMWGEPVLVMEKLQNLGSTDNPYKMGSEVIRQLKFLHTFGIHCDIKPGNVMKKVTKGMDGIDNVQYYLIDFGGVAKEKIQGGYRRWIWSPRWTCQKSHQKQQVCTPYHDFVELGFTMRNMQIWKREEETCTVDKKAVRSAFSGRLADYMRQVEKFGKNPPPQCYDVLCSILDR